MWGTWLWSVGMEEYVWYYTVLTPHPQPLHFDTHYVPLNYPLLHNIGAALVYKYAIYLAKGQENRTWLCCEACMCNS